jgi:transmembrane sensor
MSEIVKLRTRAEIEEEAALWIWQMESANVVGTTEREVFESWLREDPRHRRAVDELSKVWNALDILADAKCNGNTAGFIKAAHRAVRRERHRRWLAAAAAAALVVIVIGGSVWLRNGHEIQTVSTAVGQHRNVTLADGSIVTLNTNTIVEVALRRHLREVHLRKGEAHFEVAHDRSRPFLVHAGDAVVRAVGTGFEVRLHANRHVDVLVNEGRVEVQAELPDSPVQAIAAHSVAATVAAVHAVSAGERFSTGSADYAVTPVSSAQLSSELAWREGAIVFDSEPLSQAIVEIERYTDAKILVNDPDVAALRVGGRFRTDDLQGFLVGLETALPVTVRRHGDGLVYIDPRR